MSSSLTIAQVIVQMNNVSQAHNIDVVSHAADGIGSADEKTDPNCPIVKMFYNDKESVAVKSMCNFTATKFDGSWLMVSGSASEQ